MSAILGGSVGLNKTTAGTVTLSGANTYTGATAISAGVLNIQNASALGTIAGATTVSSGAALQIQGVITTLAEGLTLNGTGISNDGALRNISGNNTYAGAITLGERHSDQFRFGHADAQRCRGQRHQRSVQSDDRRRR